MAFDLINSKVVGIVDSQRGDSSARIKVYTIIDDNDNILKLSDLDLQEIFPPKGFVFEPGFFSKHKNRIGDIISFSVQINEQAEGNDDKYRIHSEFPNISNYGIKAKYIKGFNWIGRWTDLNTISVDDKNEEDFYGVTNKYIIGKLRLKNNKIEPALYHRIKIWDVDTNIIFSTNDKIRLIHEPKGEFTVLDCMDDKQLFEWFRDLLKQLNSDYVDLLDNKAKWRNEIPKFFTNTSKEKTEVDRIRLHRIQEKFDTIELTKSEVISLIENSYELKETVKNTVQKNINDFRENYNKELLQYKTKIDQQKKELYKEIEKIEKMRINEKEKLINLTKLTTSAETKLIEIKKNKDRIIQDFSIIKEVLQGQNQCYNSIQENQNSFVIEETIEEESNRIETIEEFDEQLKFHLSKNSINPQFATKITNVISTQKAILVKNIKIGLSIVEATNNAKYIIQQVEPDWLHFKDFWDNGLGEIWNSAHNSPDKFHFLLLEDINMSALECYCRPLLDILTGVRKRIPYGQTPYPSNLKIIATIASFEEPEIGLPVYRNTFDNWGAIGFRFDINGDTELLPELENKILNVDLLNNRNIDEFDRINIFNDNKTELDSIFES